MLLDPLCEPADRLGAALHVGLHRLDDARGLVRDQLAVLAHLLLELLGDLAVALVEVRERLREVLLDLLELRAHHLDAVQRGGLGDLADRVRRRLHRLTRAALGLGQVGQVVLEPRGAHGDRLEALVAGGDQGTDRLIPGEERHDALLLGAHVFCGGTPYLGGHLAEQAGGLVLDLAHAGLDPIVDRAAHGLIEPCFGLRHRVGLGLLATGEEPTAEESGLLRGVGRIARVHIDASLVQGAARGRPGQHRAPYRRTHVSDVGKCNECPGGWETPRAGYTGSPEAPISGTGVEGA